MAHRTTVLFDEETRRAARQLAGAYNCSTSEAIRRAIMHHRDVVLGVPTATRRQRMKALERLFDLMEGNDADEEVARLKREDLGF